MTRVGKIARLPIEFRRKLNLRLRDGEPNKSVVEWLNSLPETKEVLERSFGGRPITEQNMSEWKLGGYVDWLKNEESCGIVERLVSRASDFDAIADDTRVSDRLATVFAVELAREMESLLREQLDPKVRWERLKEMLGMLNQLRRHDHRAAILNMQEVKWNQEQDQFDEDAHQKEMSRLRRMALEPISAHFLRRRMMAVFGDDGKGQWIADYVAAIHYDLPIPPLPEDLNEQDSTTKQSNPTNSDQFRQEKP